MILWHWKFCRSVCWNQTTMASIHSLKDGSKQPRKKRKFTKDHNLQDRPIVDSPYLLKESSSAMSRDSEDVDCQIKSSQSSKLDFNFFNQSCIELAKGLLGQVLVRVVDGQRLAGTIVETEAYVGAEDTACKTFKGRKTASTKSMFLSPGHAFVYMTYGMYHCLNITSKGDGQAVLIRALAPTEGTPAMTKLREKASKRSNRQFKMKDLCNGPGKLCQSCDISRPLDGTDLTASDATMWVESGHEVSSESIVSCPRIGIDSATKEWVEMPLRFYVKGNLCVSKKNRTVEEGMNKGK